MQKLKNIRRINTLIKSVAVSFSFILSTSVALGADQNEQANTEKNKKKSVKLVSAESISGYDVFDKNGEKVGDIANFALELGNNARLTHVIIMTGGFLGFGGEARAIPTEAISWNGEKYSLSVDKETFNNVSILPDNKDRFFQRNSRLKQIAQQLDVDPVTIENEILFSDDLYQYNLESIKDGELGFLVDLYVNVNDELSPYLIIEPTDPFLDYNVTSRYAIPANELVRIEDDDLVFDISISDLEDAGSASDEGINTNRTERGLIYKLGTETANN